MLKVLKVLSFKEWLEREYYKGFDPSGLSDDEYWELEFRYSREYDRYTEYAEETEEE